MQTAMQKITAEAQRALMALFRDPDQSWVESNPRGAAVMHQGEKGVPIRRWSGAKNHIEELVRADLITASTPNTLNGNGVMWCRRNSTQSSDTFAAQHRAEVVRVLVRPDQDEGDGAVKQAMSVNVGSTAPGWLLSRGIISGEEYEAGERFRTDFDLAGMQPKLVAGAGMLPLGGAKRTGGNSIIKKVDAYERWVKAAKALGPVLADVATDACCLGLGVERIERERNIAKRAGKELLKVALVQLAAHYRGEKLK